jgi:hypothetical protein
MGGVWLGSMPEVLRDAGLDVATYPGWETRSRSSGGYDEVLAIGLHHDAITAGTPTANRAAAGWGRNQNRPIGALILSRDGSVLVGAAGATNTQGRGGPVQCSKGVIPLNAGNRYMLSIEAENDGVGEPWPQVQIDAYLLLCRALCDWLGLDPLVDIIAHFEYTDPGESIYSGSKRKIDPADVSGSTKYAAVGAVYPGMFDMNLWRADVAALERNDMKTHDPIRVYDSRDKDGPFAPGEVRHLPVVYGASCYVVLTAINMNVKGFLSVSSTGKAFPTSLVRLEPSLHASANGAPVDAPEGKIYVKASQSCHVLIDLYASGS